jgi:hypothetical protein
MTSDSGNVAATGASSPEHLHLSFESLGLDVRGGQPTKTRRAVTAFAIGEGFD